jgi:hypothetical protein
MSSQQCLGTTNSGSRCKRKCALGEYCFQHKPIVYQDAFTRVLPSIDLSDETGRNHSPFKIPNSPPRRMETRLQRRLSLHEIQIDRIVRECLEEPQDRVKPRPPQRPRGRKSEVVKPCRTEDCCICYDQQVNQDDFLDCGHSVCKTCIGKLRDVRCPMCRVPISAKFISEQDKKKMANRKKADISERNEEASIQYLMNLPLVSLTSRRRTSVL